MNTITDTKNIIRITADAKKFDSPRDDITDAPVKFRRFDRVRIDVVFRVNGTPADFSNAAYAELEIIEIGAYNTPEPRTATTLVRKRVETADINSSATETELANGAAHASFVLDKPETLMESGEKWMRIYVVDTDGGRISYTNGWITVMPTYGEDSNVVAPDEYAYTVKVREEALKAEGYAVGTQNGTEVDNTSPYRQNNSKYFSMIASLEAENVKSTVLKSEGYSLGTQNGVDAASNSEYYHNNAKWYKDAAAQSAETASQKCTQAETARTAAEAAKTAAESAKAAAQTAASAALETDAGELARTRERIGVFHFGSAGGALQTSGNPMYGVLDQSHCITFELDEDWNIPTSVAASLNMFGDNFYESGYRGIGAAFSTTGRIAVRVGDGSSNGGAFQYVPLLRQIFGGSNEMIIPAGKYAVCFCIHFGDTTQDSDGNYLNPSTCKVYTNGVYKCSCGQLKHKVDNAWVVFGASEVVWSQNSKLGFFDTTNFHKTDQTSFNYGHYEGKANRFAVFNFDMSAADAPYTPSDYASGKKIPLALCSSTAEKRCILATADYTFGGKVRDISGNENHLTVCGDVKGDKDEAVKQMYNAFSAAYTDEHPTT